MPGGQFPGRAAPIPCKWIQTIMKTRLALSLVTSLNHNVALVRAGDVAFTG
jgi:hypothetical protein